VPAFTRTRSKTRGPIETPVAGGARTGLPPALFALAAAVAVARWITRARLFYNWDSVQYALGIRHYDLRTHQPHPPGSAYYIILGRALNAFLHDPHASLLAISAIASALTVFALYALGSELAGSPGGWWAAVLGAVSPLFWFYGSVGLNYVTDGLFAALTGYYSLRLWRGDTTLRTAALAGLSLGATGGFRPTTIVFLLPIWLLGVGRLRRFRGSAMRSTAGSREQQSERNGGASDGAERARWPDAWRAAAISAGLVAILTLGWLIPTAAASGGPGTYLRLTREMDSTLHVSAVWEVADPRAALRFAGFSHRRCFESMLGLAWLLLPFAIAATWRRPRRIDYRELLFWSAWILPPFAFFLLVHFNMSGYSLVYAPAVIALASCPLGAATARWPAVGTVAAAVVAVVNAALFWVGFPKASPNLGQRAISRPEIAQHDAYWSTLRDYLSRYPPGSVRLVVPGTSTEGLRPAEALIPEHAGDICQIAGSFHLPRSIARQTFLHFCSLHALLAEPRPILAVWRTADDHSSLRNALAPARARIELLPIGAGFRVARVLPRLSPSPPLSPALRR
jgi:hypothetical protein